MGGHKVVVGNGRFATPLVKRPNAAQLRKAAKANHGKTPAHVVPGKPSLQSQVAALQQQMAQVQSQAALQQLQTVMISKKADTHEYLHRQHDTWDADFTAYLTAILMAERDFHDIMEQKTPPSLLAQIIGSVLTVIIFTVAPELLPFKQVAEKLKKNEEHIKLLAKAVTDLTKESVEVFKKRAEASESGDDKEAANSLAIKFFGQLYRMVNEQKNAMTNAVNDLGAWLDKADTMELPVRIPMVMTQFAASGYDRKDTTRANIDASQLALCFLYDIMRQYVKSVVVLRAVVLPPDSSNLTTSLVGRFDVPIGKSEFKRRRADNPDFDVEFEGLDSARRKRMYEKFAEIRWVDPKCPRISTWLELIDRWEFKEEA
jgi:hypothetical protein